MKTKPTFKFVFMHHRYNTIYIMGIKKTRKLEKIFTYKGKKFPISIDKPTYMNGSCSVFCIMYETSEQLNFKKLESSIDPESLDIITGQDIIRQLTAGVMDNAKEKLGVMLLGALLGALIVGIIMVIYYSGKIEQIYKDDADIPFVPNIVPVVSSLFWRV